MSDKFQNRYRIPSARASWWDYSQNGLYFITICTANRKTILGNIENKQMVLSHIGIMVKEEWEKSFSIRNELFCDIYVIMPNHIHATLRIDNNDETNGGNDTIVGGNTNDGCGTNGGGDMNDGGNTNVGNNDSNGGCTAVRFNHQTNNHSQTIMALRFGFRNQYHRLWKGSNRRQPYR
jgi:hypothetical protein